MKKLLITSFAIVFLAACSTALPLTSEQTYKMEPSNSQVVAATVLGSYPINPEYVTLRLTNPHDTEFTASVMMQYCNDGSASFKVPARNTVSKKIWAGCSGRTKKGLAVVTLYDNENMYVQKLSW